MMLQEPSASLAANSFALISVRGVSTPSRTHPSDKQAQELRE
jgi:hypothetical protein